MAPKGELILTLLCRYRFSILLLHIPPPPMHFFSAELSLPLSDSESLPRFDSCPPAHSREDERDAKGLAELNSLLILQPTFEDVFLT